jgi:tRNA(fMet)-specific endonuclease VapC
MNYLLDANACIALINNDPPVVRERFRQALEDGSRIVVSAVSLYELWYGVARIPQEEQKPHGQRVQTFLAGSIELLAFDDDDARMTGFVRAGLETAGVRLGAYDLQTAGQAVLRKMTLVTVNLPEYAAVDKLVWEDWSQSASAEPAPP